MDSCGWAPHRPRTHPPARPPARPPTSRLFTSVTAALKAVPSTSTTRYLSWISHTGEGAGGPAACSSLRTSSSLGAPAAAPPPPLPLTLAPSAATATHPHHQHASSTVVNARAPIGCAGSPCVHPPLLEARARVRACVWGGGLDLRPACPRVPLCVCVRRVCGGGGGRREVVRRRSPAARARMPAVPIWLASGAPHPLRLPPRPPTRRTARWSPSRRAAMP